MRIILKMYLKKEYGVVRAIFIGLRIGTTCRLM
jgi:hypothetical protein